MINIEEVFETNEMILHENLDVRTVTMGISLFDCISDSLDETCRRIEEKLKRCAGNLAPTADRIAKDFGIPIINKRISVTPISLIGASCCHTPEDYVRICITLDRTAKELGINFLGGFSAIVSKGITPSDHLLMESLPEALAVTDNV